MSADRGARGARGSIVAALALGLALALGAMPARAEESPAAAIAAALHQSPVYVDPSLASALPPDQQQQLVDAIHRATVPIFLVILPLVQGDTWGGSAEQLTTVVHDRLGRDGVFLTLDKDGNDSLAGFEWPPDVHQARYAAWTPGFEDNLTRAGLEPRLARAIELIQSGTGRQAYDAASRPFDHPATAPRPSSGGGGGGSKTGWAAGFLTLALAIGAGAVVVTRRRRGAAGPGSGDPFRLPRQVFVTASQASEDELRTRAGDEVVAFGELLDKEDFSPQQPPAQADLQRALDAYMAAGKVADAATAPVDWVGVLVLVDAGRDAYAAARAREAGRPPKKTNGLCFFNPLHGDALQVVDYRPLGQRAHLRAPACRACATAVAAHDAPEVLTDRVDGHDVPYFEVDPAHSVWAATGYGALRDDLVARILRGDFSHRPRR